MALQGNTLFRYLILSFAVLFAMLRSTQYFHAQPLSPSSKGRHQVVQYQAKGQQHILTRHMEKTIEERFTSAYIPAIQFNGIIFLSFWVLPFVFKFRTLYNSLFPPSQLSNIDRRTRLCVFRL